MKKHALQLLLVAIFLTGCAGQNTNLVPANRGTALQIERGPGFAGPKSIAESSSTPSPYAVGYQINDEHSGSIAGPTTKLPMSVQWTTVVNQWSTYPVIATGRVFIGGQYLWSLAAYSGAMIWEKNQPSIGLAYDNGKIFSMTGSGGLSAFTELGKPLWFATFSNQWIFSTPPAARYGIVYTSGSGDGGTLYAVDERSGKTIWAQSVDGGASSSPAVSASGVYVSYAGPQVYDFNPKTGVTIWHYSSGGGSFGATPVLYDQELYTNSSGNNPAGVIFNALNGTLLGTFNSGVTPAFAKGLGYFLENGDLLAINTTTNNVKWTATPANGDLYTTPAIVITNTVSGDLVAIGSESGNVYIYNAKTGAALQTIPLASGAISGNLAYSQGLLVACAGQYVIGIR